MIQTWTQLRRDLSRAEKKTRFPGVAFMEKMREVFPQAFPEDVERAVRIMLAKDALMDGNRWAYARGVLSSLLKERVMDEFESAHAQTKGRSTATERAGTGSGSSAIVDAARRS